MPKVVDHDGRRSELAEAVWRLVERAGVEAVSVRSIAREAGWSTGSVAHYFPHRDELLVHAFALASDRVVGRMREASSPRELLREALPLDRERRLLAAMWFGFLGHALGHDGMRAELRRRYEEWQELLGGGGRAAALIAAVDGITVQALVAPDAMPAARQEALLDAALTSAP